VTVSALKKFLISISLLFFISACTSPQKDTSTTTGGGTTTGTTTATDADDTLTTAGTVDPEEESSIVPGSPDDFIINVGDRIFFSYESFDLDADAQETLQLQAAWLKQHQEVTVTIEGHCDERGTREYNLALGEKRAQAAKNYLIALGVDVSRVSTISYGKEMPAVVGSNDDAWNQNRRSVAVIN
jgi:peptidoglycan-associated lipoprotein